MSLFLLLLLNCIIRSKYELYFVFLHWWWLWYWRDLCSFLFLLSWKWNINYAKCSIHWKKEKKKSRLVFVIIVSLNLFIHHVSVNLICLIRRCWCCIYSWCYWALLAFYPHRASWMPCSTDNTTQPNIDYRHWNQTNDRRHFLHRKYLHKQRMLCRVFQVCCHWKIWEINQFSFKWQWAKEGRSISNKIFTLVSVGWHRICRKYRTFHQM